MPIDVIHTQLELVDGEHLLNFSGVDGGIRIEWISLVDFYAGKLGIEKLRIKSYHIHAEHVVLMELER